MNRRYLLNGFKYALGIGLLAFQIWWHWTAPEGSKGIGLRDALAKPLQLIPLVLAILIYTTGVLLTFWRWFILVRAQQLPFTPGNALRLGLMGFFCSTFLPGSIGGDIFKAAFIAREQSRRTVAVATVLIDRAMGLWGILWMTALLGGVFWLFRDATILNSTYLRSIITASLIIIGITVGLWLILGILPARRAERFAKRLIHIPKVGQSAEQFWRAVWLYRKKVGSISAALLLSLASQVCFIFTIYFAAQIFQDPAEPTPFPTLQQHFLLIPGGVAVQALFPLPNGIGSEGFFGWLYARVDETMWNAGLLAAMSQRIIIWVLAVIGYYTYLRMRPALPPSAQEEPALAAVPTAS